MRRALTALAVLSGAAPAGSFSAGSAEAAAAVYEGTWNNITFGSSGAVSITIDLNPAAPLLVVDFDGPVFGGGNPPPLNLTGTSDGTDANFAASGDGVFGDVALSIVGSVVSATLTNIPNTGIDQATVDSIARAGLTENLIALNYTVFFSGGGGEAVGTMSADRVNPVPLPGAVWLFASALVGLGVMRSHWPARA